MNRNWPTEDETGAYPGSNAPDKSGAPAVPNQLAPDRAELEELRRLAGTRAARDLLGERMRQVEAEGWTPAYDDRHRPYPALAFAAACYALHASGAGEYKAFWESTQQRRPFWWPWSLKWWKPRNPRRDLVRAGALILAELERLDRAEERAKHSAPRAPHAGRNHV